MAPRPELVYCAADGKRFAEIAIATGFRYGARLPDRVLFPVWFADQNWKQPNRAAYMDALAKHRPHTATVLDWEREEQLPEVLSWAEEAAQYVSRVVIVPKCGGVSQLPRHIGGAEVVLGFSVPTRYGGNGTFLSEFSGWPMHLLGGTPHVQMALWRDYFREQVVSVDGNTALLGAVRWGKAWAEGRFVGLHELMGYQETDVPYKTFELSCKNIMDAWEQLCG